MIMWSAGSKERCSQSRTARSRVRCGARIRATSLTRLVSLLLLTAIGCMRYDLSDKLDYAAKPGFVPPPPSPSGSTVIFFRPDDIRALAASILDGEAFVTILTAQTHYAYVTAPGKHRFMAHVTRYGPSYVDADLAAGKTYFVAVKSLESGFRVWIQMIPITPNDQYWTNLPEWLAKSKLVHPNAEAFAWFERHRGELMSEQSIRPEDARITQLSPDAGVDHAP